MSVLVARRNRFGVAWGKGEKEALGMAQVTYDPCEAALIDARSFAGCCQMRLLSQTSTSSGSDRHQDDVALGFDPVCIAQATKCS